jgi:polyribonucleotide nucleotidyltransferase
MTATIAAPRDDVRPSAPKIISFEIPIDKIGEVIGPKGKVINTIQQETGADIAVSDDGVVGTVSIGSKDGEKVEEATRRIELILDPPTAEIGVDYTGKVVNVTKFGAFVNILPGRDGLVHISKLGRGKRVDRVEDVLNLGDEVTVRVDDIDNQGKLSLSLVGDEWEGGDGGSGGSGGGDDGPPRRERQPASDRGDRPERAPRESNANSGNGGSSSDAGSGDRDRASFDEFWDGQASEEFGELGPAEAGRSGGGDRGGRPSGGGGGSRRRRR